MQKFKFGVPSAIAVEGIAACINVNITKGIVRTDDVYLGSKSRTSNVLISVFIFLQGEVVELTTPTISPQRFSSVTCCYQ